MAEQSFKNHSRMVPPFHYGAFTLVLFSLVIAVIHFFKAVAAASGRLQAAAGLSLVVAVILALWYARSFALRAQDRAIRAEENFRHYLLTGKPLPQGLRIQQIIALRFAGDSELPLLAQRAATEKLTNKQIKEAVQHWRADYNRV